MTSLVVRVVLVAVACAAPRMPLGAAERQQQPPAPAQKKADELGEVLVEATRQREKRPGFKQYEQNFNWLARMVGTFVIDGRLDVAAAGTGAGPRMVTGRAVCIGFGAAPGVQCDLKMRWPDSPGADGGEILDGISSLDPASALFGFDLAKSGIPYILVDSKGTAETAQGTLITADTLQSRARCGAIAGNCERISRFTAHPDLKTVDLNMDVRVDDKSVANFTLVMHRVPGRPSTVYGREPQKVRK